MNGWSATLRSGLNLGKRDCFVIGIAQYFSNNTKGTNTIELLDLDEIARIPKGKIVMYAHIVVDSWPKRKTQIRSATPRGKFD